MANPTDPTDLGERAITMAQNLIRRGKDVARRESRILQLQAQTSKLRSQRQQLYVEMGQKVFDLFQRDLVKNQELRLLCQQIRRIDAEVATRREEIEQLRRPETAGEAGVDSEPPFPTSDITRDDDSSGL